VINYRQSGFSFWGRSGGLTIRYDRRD